MARWPSNITGAMRSTIRQFDVFRNPIAAARGEQPFVVCVQHRNLDYLGTRLIAPLASAKIVREQSRLHPAVEVLRKTVYLLPQNLLALPVRLFRDSVENLEPDRERIIAALDLVLTGV